MHKGAILVVGALDTKGPEVEYIKQNIERRGHKVIVLDSGILGSPVLMPELSREEVAHAAGTTLQDIINLQDRPKAIDIVAKGIKNIVVELYEKGNFNGIISLGGGTGTALASPAMRALPYGVPKFMVSTLKITQVGIRAYMGNRDITVMVVPTEISGLNRVTAKMLSYAAGAISGMVEVGEVKFAQKPLVVMGMLGTTTQCGLAVKSYLEIRGYEVLVFEARGLGGKALEEFVESNPVVGVIELAMNEIGNEMFGGLASAGKHRLEAAGRKGIPQVITPGNIEFINFLGPETVPGKYRHRKFVLHNPQASSLGLNAKEMRMVAKAIARKLNLAKGPTAVLIPVEGFSSVNKQGHPLYNPKLNRIFIDTLRQHLQPQVAFKERQAHMNDRQFAEFIGQIFEELVPPSA